MRANRVLPLLTLTLAALSGCGNDVALPNGAGPGRLVKVSGDGQQSPPGETLANPLVVRVLDGTGQAAPGTEVSFTGATGGPDVDPAVAVADENGQALTRVTLGEVEGSQTISVRVGGDGSPLALEFHAMAVAIRDGGGDGGGDHGGDDEHGGGGDHGGGGHHGGGGDNQGGDED